MLKNVQSNKNVIKISMFFSDSIGYITFLFYFVCYNGQAEAR